jgi:hypothetical protein
MYFLWRKQMTKAHHILWNFHPFGRRSQKNATDTVSPFQKLNGFSYHPNWLSKWA